MKFKSDIEVQAGIKDKDGQTGSSGQILASTGSQVDWIDQDAIISAASKLVVIACKNTSGATITKGTPVYQTGTVGATDVIEVAEADASDEDKMAAIGLLQTDINNNDFGNVVITGELLNITTSPIDGVTPTTGDTIYVKSGGGLTLTKPTGVNFIQNVGLVSKVSGGNAGSITVSSIMRSNDVPTPLYIDHDNQRLGVGETSPDVKLHVAGDSTAAAFSTVLKVESTADEGSVQDIHIYNQYDRDIGIKFETLGGENYIWQDSNGDDALIFSTGGSNRTNDAALILEQDQDVIVPNGKLGVGLSSPSTTLHVGGFTRMNGGLQMNTANATIYQIQDSALRFGTNNTERMRIDADGNVGIGTTSPDAKLHLKLNTSGATPISQQQLILENNTATGIAILTPSTTSGYLFFGDNNDAQRGYIAYTHASDEMKFKVAGSERMVIDTNGNVGIGTTSPDYTLDVNGIIRSENSSEVGTLYLGNTAQSEIPGGAIIGQRSPNYSSTGNLLFQVPTWGANTDYGLTTQMSIEVTGADTKKATISMIPFGGNVEITDALLSNQENTDIDTGAEVVAQVAIATYTAAFFDFVVKKGTNVRSGTVYACHNGDSTPLVEFTETSTNDLGDTSDVTLSVDISGANMRLLATVTSDDWSVKSLIRAI